MYVSFMQNLFCMFNQFDFIVAPSESSVSSAASDGWEGEVDEPDGGAPGAFRAAEEFTLRYGRDLPDAQYVTKIYENALGRLPDEPGLDYWTGLLRGGVLNRDQVLVEFADSPENIGLPAPTMSTGFWVI